MQSATYRRWFGLFFGAIIGFVCLLVSQTVNHLVLPTIPLYQPPFGMWGNIALGTLLGMLLGLLTAWSDTGVRGVIWSSLLGALAVTIPLLLTSSQSMHTQIIKITAVLIIFIPTAALLAPALMLLRWEITREEDAFREQRNGLLTTPLARLALPASMLVVAALLGLTVLYNDLAQSAMPRMQAILQQGQVAPDAASLPAVLRPPNVESFSAHAQQPYALEWDKDDDNRYAIPRPATNTFDQSIVIAHFADGYRLVCLFYDTTSDPECRER